jgi:hydroxymethylbilane synthase
MTFSHLDFARMVPAVGQGAIAIQCRAVEGAAFRAAFDESTAASVALERAFQALLGAGCHTAFAAHAAPDEIFFFHERTGLRRFPRASGDAADPAGTAARLLKALGLP